jgi:hypothetical protein
MSSRSQAKGDLARSPGRDVRRPSRNQARSDTSECFCGLPTVVCWGVFC